jgi:hypothetical protein
MTESRSAAAQAGAVDQPMLVMNALAALIGATTVPQCGDVWNTYVVPVEDQLHPETVEQIGRAVAIRIEAIVKS